MKRKNTFLPFFILILFFSSEIQSQHSIARQWNEQLLEAIRNDFARPTVHARNLFHSSVLMYDAWAIFDATALPFFLGNNTLGNYLVDYQSIPIPTNIDEARKEIISFAMYRLLSHRFNNSPNAQETLASFDAFFSTLGYDKNNTSTNYSTGSYAALGNYMAEKMIEFGLQDGANESELYENQFYTPINDPLVLDLYQDNSTINPNRWQPLAFDVFIGQSGIISPLNIPKFLGPEWGKVVPFALKEEDLTVLNNGFDSYIYNNPGNPLYIQESNENGISDPYKWHFSLVISWSAHLDTNDNKLIDISPAAIGNVAIADFPTTFEEYKNFYDFENGGDIGTGYAINPHTNASYQSNIVKRGDYARVLAEFWADGPDSETPPGHWFTILNYVSDHPKIVKRFGNSIDVLNDLEWDVKSYLTLGGAMHDAAINIWGIKGYYDYIRPISAIRYMASNGQSTDASLPSYHPHGLPLIENLIEIIQEGDVLAGSSNQNVGKVKVKSWKGPDFINDPEIDIAGVDWIVGKHWWPYQRPTFVTPPFAGYLSGHSAFSRAAAEVLTLITNDAFFPGGLGSFNATKNEFLVFEEGPTEDIILQWATYRDASDQTSLSRIWGGIHPPIDDIKGRIIGNKIGENAFEYASNFFNKRSSEITSKVFPIPFGNTMNIRTSYNGKFSVAIYTILSEKIFSKNIEANFNQISIDLSELESGIYFCKAINDKNEPVFLKKIIKID